MGNQVLYHHMQNCTYGDRRTHMGILVCIRVGINKIFAYGEPRSHNKIVRILGATYTPCRVAWEGVCLQGGIAVGAGYMARLPLLACLESESHAMVGGSRNLCANSARGADHGLCLQKNGFKAKALKEFNQDVQCCLKEHWILQRKVGIIHIENCKKTRISLVRYSSPWSFAASCGSWTSHSRATASTSRLKSFADRGPPWVTPRLALKGTP